MMAGVVVFVVGAYIAAAYGLSLLVGSWAFPAVLIPTLMPSVFGACWLADRVVPRDP